MPRTVTKRCFECRGLLPGILRRRWIETTAGWLCDGCVTKLPKNKIGEPLFPEIHDEGDVIGPQPERPLPARDFRRCPTYYDGCNCIQAAADAHNI